MAKDPNSAKTGAQVERKVVSWRRGENGGVESGVHEALATWPNRELTVMSYSKNVRHKPDTDGTTADNAIGPSQILSRLVSRRAAKRKFLKHPSFAPFVLTDSYTDPISKQH